VSAARSYVTGGTSNAEAWLARPGRLGAELKMSPNTAECCCGVVRTRSTLRIATSLARAIAVTGCARLSPAGFWTRYRAGLIVQKYGNQ
jgi:hypothetical protein